MDLKAFLKPDIQKFIHDHREDTLSSLALSLGKDKNLPAKEILDQVQGRQKARNKLPSWVKTPGIIFPPGISIEQSSSERTALYKSTLISGNKLIDLSAGFGVDSACFSKVFNEIVLVEPKPELIEIVKHNFSRLNIGNAYFFNDSAENFVKNYNQKADCIYIDPSRRSAFNKKHIRLKDCEPDVIPLLPSLFSISATLLVKTAPLLDIHAALADLTFVKKIIVLAHNNECKEVLYLLEYGYEGLPVIEAVNLKDGEQQMLSFTFMEEKNAIVSYSYPLTYLFEPNAAIMKSGAFKIVAEKYGLKKLHPNSHLYTSEKKIKDFPGRIFKVNAVCKYNKKDIFAKLTQNKANVTVRNFKGSVKDILKKTGLLEGGTDYIFATTGPDEKPVMIICRKEVSF